MFFFFFYQQFKSSNEKDGAESVMEMVDLKKEEEGDRVIKMPPFFLVLSAP